MADSIVGPWAREKLDHLRKYLHAYTTIMGKQKWCKSFTYIDAFAGPGEHQVRPKRSAVPNARELLAEIARFGSEQEEQREFLRGSPRVALDLEHPFSLYVFVERSPNRVAALQQLKNQYGDTRDIRIRKADCQTYLRETLGQIDWRVNRAIVFLDPFGMQVDWETIELLAQTKAIEILLNLPVGMAIQRLLLRKPENFTPARRQSLNDYFGSSEWFNAIYKREKNLFDEDVEQKVEQSGKRLLQWYRGRLRDCFRNVSKAALIRNSRGGHLYYLMLASYNPTGVKIANNILSAGELVE